jgi:hypothetical protein
MNFVKRFSNAFPFWKREELCRENKDTFAYPYYPEAPRVLLNTTIHVSTVGLYAAVLLIPLFLVKDQIMNSSLMK